MADSGVSFETFRKGVVPGAVLVVNSTWVYLVLQKGNVWSSTPSKLTVIALCWSRIPRSTWKPHVAQWTIFANDYRPTESMALPPGLE